MGVVQVKKVVAVCFLEAVKLALEHLGTYRLEMSQHGVVGSPELPRLYGEARRLRDYLQRCASAYQDLVDLDLADAGKIERLPRVGPALARRIVANRDSLGAFGVLSALGRVKGMGPATLARLAPLVTFSGQARR